MTICFVQIVTVCVVRLADRNPSFPLVTKSQIEWMTHFFVADAWKWQSMGQKFVHRTLCAL